jgi:ABC-2 type transport system permease protein
VSAFRGFVRKETYHLLRDRRTLAVLVMLPVVQVLLFGYAIRTDVEDVRIAVVDPAPDAATLALRARLDATGLFRTVAVLASPGGLAPLFERGAARGAVVFEPGFARRLGAGDAARILLITDATDPNQGATVQAYAREVIQRWERERRAEGPGVTIVPVARMRFNPTLESANLFVPGLIVFVLAIVSALMTSISITREKETGTMEVLLVSPLRPMQIVVGKVLPYLALSFLNVLTVLVLARAVFDVPLRGSLPLLLAESLLFIVASLAVGVLISTRTDSQRVAMTAALAGMLMPTLMLSGFIFPLESMPRVLQWLSNVIPAKWFLLITRGIMLKGVGLRYLWRETLVLVVMTVALLAISARNFKVRLE